VPEPRADGRGPDWKRAKEGDFRCVSEKKREREGEGGRTKLILRNEQTEIQDDSEGGLEERRLRPKKVDWKGRKYRFR